ncbi:MAG: YdcF family protein [Fibrobacterota bacterium]
MDTFFFIAAKVFWNLMSPANLLVYAYTAAAVLLHLGRRGPGQIILTIAVTLTLVIHIFPVGDWLLYPLEKRWSRKDLPRNPAGIIVLSGSEHPRISAAWNHPEFSEAGERLTAFVSLMRRFPHAQCVHSGGSGRLFDQTLKEADIAKEIYTRLGADTGRIIFERRSRNTWENVQYSKKLIQPAHDRPWILITSAAHMVRAKKIFDKADWPVVPYPVDYRSLPGEMFTPNFSFQRNLTQLTGAVREWIGLAAYRISGKTNSFLP